MIQIYNDTDAKAVFIKDANGSRNMNTLQAILKNPADTFISVYDLAKEIYIISDVEHDEFVDESENVWGANATAVMNALNVEFTAGASNGVIPVITSNLAINIVAGDSISYELTGTNGSEVIWDFSNVTSVIATNENRYKINGGTALTAGTYNIPVLLQNSSGEDSETLVVTVATPAYSNTKSVIFQNNDYCSASATTSNPFYRASNGSGSGDAWTMVTWFKSGSNSNAEQTLISFGGTNNNNDGRITLLYDGSSGDKKFILRYGSNTNKIVLKTPDLSMLHDTWANIVVTYDGGTTGVASGDISDYYGRFEIWIDGVSQTLTGSNNNFGWDGEIEATMFKLGESASGAKHLRGCNIDELALWDSDQSANIATIYNGGTTHDLALLSPSPLHYWKMGDGDTFPDLQDSIGSLDFEMFNMTDTDIVNDVP